MDFGTVLTGFSVCRLCDQSKALVLVQLKVTHTSIQKPRVLHSLYLQALRRLGDIEVLATTFYNTLTSSSQQWARLSRVLLAGKKRGEWEHVLSKESPFGLEVACSLTLPYVLPDSGFFAGWLCCTDKANLTSRVVTAKPTLWERKKVSTLKRAWAVCRPSKCNLWAPPFESRCFEMKRCTQTLSRRAYSMFVAERSNFFVGDPGCFIVCITSLVAELLWECLCAD